MLLFRHLFKGFAISCLLLATWPAGASAQSGQPTPDSVLRKFDRDHDGKVSREEFAGPPERFAKFDIDGDGFATKGELETFFAARTRVTQGAPGAAENDPLAAWYANLPVILTHTHIWPSAKRRENFDDWDGATRNGLKLLDDNGIRAAIVMPTPSPMRNSDLSFFDGLLRATRKYSDRFKLAGGGKSLNGMIGGIRPEYVDDNVRRRFIARAEELIRKGAIGFGETTALHFSQFEGHPFEEAPPDHPLYLLLADLAAKHDVPLDIHMEAVTHDWTVSDDLRKRGRINPGMVNENIAAFERLLAHNPTARIIWVHLGVNNTGQRSPELMTRLFRKYPNLYASISGGHRFTRTDRLIVPGAGLDPRWRAFFLEFSDRLMIGSDAFFQPEQPRHKMPEFLASTIRLVRSTKFLPPDVARKVAFENAQRVFKLDLIKLDDVPLPDRTPSTSAPLENKRAGTLAEAEIRRILIGNTISFQAPRDQRTMFVYLAEDGSAVIRSSDDPALRPTKNWFFKDGGVFCRTVGPQNRDHCAEVVAGPGDDTVEFVLPTRRYTAKVLAGRQLPH